MIEIEIKARVKDRDEVKEKITKIGDFIGIQHQEDIYFDSPYQNFVKSGEVLRVRKSQHKHVLTYKKKRPDEKARVRTEHEVMVESGDEVAEILKDLGFVLIARIRKARESYKVDGCNVELDMVKGLGVFIEVEIVIPETEDIDSGKEKIFALLDKIGVPRENIEEKSYLELCLDKSDLL